MKTTLLAILFFVTLFSLQTTTVSAQEKGGNGQIILEVINPDSAFQYRLKRLGEKFRTITTNIFNKSKTGELMLELTQKRAKELLYIVDKQKTEHLEITTSRFITYTGLLTNELKEGVNKEEVANKMKVYIAPLTKLRDNFPAQTAQWLFLQQAIDSTNVLLSQSS